MSLTFKKFSKLNKKRCEEVFHNVDKWTPNDWGTALGGEVGEALNFLEKMRRISEVPFWDSDLDKDWSTGELNKYDKYIESVGKELADVIHYVDLLATRLGIDLEQVIIDKFNEVSDRYKCEIKL